MYLTNTGLIEKNEFTRKVSSKNFAVYWEGLIFYPELEEGSVTIQKFLECIDALNYPIDIIKKTNALRGNWCLFINHLHEGYWIVCSDHSHQNNIFFSKYAISTSFLRLRNDKSDRSKITNEALILMLLSGLCYSNTVIYDDINRLNFSNYLVVKYKQIYIFSKEFECKISYKDKHKNFTDIFNTFFNSLSKNRICLDLTGGTDTRTILILLDYYGYDFDVAINGDKNFSEAIIASKVAEQIEKELQCFEIDVNQIKPEDLRLSWKACDGLDLSIMSYYFESWRKKSGYTLIISGRGGNIYKDDTFFRYAVLYSILFKNVRHLVNTLIQKGILFWWGLPVKEFKSILTNKYSSIAIEVLKNKTTEIINKYSGYSLIEVANHIFYEFSLNCPNGNGNTFVNRYNPLYEPELVNIGMDLSVIERFNCNFYKKSSGILNPSVANITTFPFGHKMSSSLAYGISDWIKLIRHAFLKIINFNLDYSWSPNKNQLTLEQFIFNHPNVITALESLKDRGIIQGKVNIKDMNYKLAKNVLIVHYLMEN